MINLILVLFSIVFCITTSQKSYNSDSFNDARRGFYKDVAASSTGGRLNYTKSLVIREEGSCLRENADSYSGSYT